MIKTIQVTGEQKILPCMSFRQKKIIIITQGLSPIVKPIVNSDFCSVLGIIECAPRVRQKRSLVQSVKFRLRTLLGKTLNGYAFWKKIPYFYMERSNEELKNWILNLNPDLIAVYSMSQLLKEEIFTIPRLGTINLHPALLPSYRGPNPYFWMFYNMDLNPGVTIHYIDKGEDTGDILLQKQFTVPLGVSFQEFHDIGIKFGVNLMLEAIKDLETLNPVRQPKNSPTMRARNIKAEEHATIINWNDWQIERIWHLLRGTQDWFNAIQQPVGIFHLGVRWRIGEYIKGDYSLKAGEVYKNVYNEKFVLACKDGLIILHKQYKLIKQFKDIMLHIKSATKIG